MTLHPILGSTDSLDSAEHAPLIVVRAGSGNGKKGSFSIDGGVDWREFPTEPPGANGGSIVLNSTAQVILWATGGATWESFDFGATWSKCAGLAGRVQLVADRVAPTRLYAVSASTVFVSDDTGAHFAAIDATGFPGQHGTVRAVTDRVGDLWAPSDAGLFHSIDGAKSFGRLPLVDAAQSVGFGKGAPGSAYPAIFINGKVQGRTGVFRSDDGGRSWIRITDDQHEYAVRNVVIGDPRIYGRVYLGTNGRGVLYGDPQR
jgi:hypothetical protein